MDNTLRSNLYKYTGDISQVFYAKKYKCCGGKADGMMAVEISSGAGLQFTVLADRAMDIGQLSFKGVNYSYSTKAGYVSPVYFDYKEWGKSFGAGFLTTCGLTQVGPPCECDGECLGLHGEISGVPAEDFCSEVNMDEDIPEIIVKGKMRIGQIFGQNLRMTREIRVKYGINNIHIKDIVENRDGNQCPYMIMYHFNMGYPLLTENAQFSTSAKYIRPRDSEAKKGEDNRATFEKPQLNFKEQVYYYRNIANDQGLSYTGIINGNMGLKIWVNPKQLPNLIQWKNPGVGDYVMGIEPANCFPEGRAKQKEYGLDFIEPCSKKVQEIYIDIF